MAVPADRVNVDRSRVYETRSAKSVVAELASIYASKSSYKSVQAFKIGDGDDDDTRSLIKDPGDALSGPMAQLAHPLLKSAYLAFAHHLPLVLSPDALWLSVVQGVAHHVNTYVDAREGNVVTGKGHKVSLKIRNDSLRGIHMKGDGREVGDLYTTKIAEEWEKTMPLFVNGMKEHIQNNGNDALARALSVKFSTTTPAARMATVAGLADALQHFFKYTVYTRCGIPNVYLKGTRADWILLSKAIGDLLDAFPPESVSRKRTRKASSYKPLDLQAWKAKMQNILARIVEAYDASEAELSSPESRAFWSAAIKKKGVQSSGRLLDISGWLACFVGYLNNGRPNWQASDKPGEFSNMVATSSEFGTGTADNNRHENSGWEQRAREGDPTLYRDPAYIAHVLNSFQMQAMDDRNSSKRFEENDDEDDDEEKGEEPNAFPSCINKMPFVWNYYGMERDMLMCGGLFGVMQYRDSLAVEAVPGWMIVDA